MDFVCHCTFGKLVTEVGNFTKNKPKRSVQKFSKPDLHVIVADLYFFK